MENFSAEERRKQAIEAVSKIATSYNIKFHTLKILEDSNNTVIYLAPSSIVAKVSTSILQKQKISNLKHELNVGLYLTKHDAPVVPPSKELPAIVYRYNNLEVTFWQYCMGEIREKLDEIKLVTAIEQFQASFSGYQGELRLFTENYQECCLLLNSDRLSPELSTNDRQFLLQVYEYLSARLHAFKYKCVPIHTEIHSGNVMWQNNKPLLIDFESCCLGPRELDFLLFSEKTLSACPGININRELVKVLSELKSFCVTVYCYLQLDRSPKMREAAQYHIDRLYSLN